ncbi:ABC transporter ATP-binding protein [Chryseobacterium sp. cx-311]|uniref:ATP-binding cassette domain-containing protein n=1 Tax=Marnyiella aurantia TaxID=2758037 RepID=UPI001AEA6235|nr:ABC transporter ATP-binding protein [Marnyiella aurantia]MBP0613909.1 ABC transporter ATP-binding protein [Marnyiella aurantia]
MLIIKNLKVTYRNNVVLKNVNLDIDYGKITGILGKNGAGKTTLFESIFQSINYSGSILLQNEIITRNKIAYLETDNYFYPYITGNEYLKYFSPEKRTESIEQIINQLNLPLNKYVQHYSSGMKKKLAMIGVILLDKKVVILDEPFNGVDFEGVHLFYEIINNMRRENKIIIISSHIIETLFNTCDNIIILENGMIEKKYEKNSFDKLIGFKF